ncbi:oxidoreductase [Actinoplanes ianthinogenes]|uniref:Oxidoreductase n=1 Tax=Actinoplanes ianthinogenes TaxID=122358 RepID=A0ABM7LKA2_9ACTN|nr:GMC family oxidoreductase [Actinoplanes ianthinogenes]BCJ39688.1 oxidoreductase [Actinoplanes ianthinogenes]GGR48112.1 oxidoreductase [Actinoplanes ianthinogenes]
MTEPTRTLTGGHPPPEHARVVIVGGGFAGLETARHLAEAGVDDILVVEGGPVGDLVHTNVAHDPDTAVEMWLDPERDPYHRRPWSSDSDRHFAGNAGIRARLGGRSLYWYGVTLPIDSWALDEQHWPAAVADDLTRSWRGGPSLYERVAGDLGLTWADGTIASTGQAQRVGGFTLRPTPRASRAHPGRPGRWSAYSPLDHWRDPATGAVGEPPAGVRFLLDSPVQRVLLRDGRAAGIVVDDRRTGRPATVTAETVVLCAGTVENSRLAIQALTTATGAPPRLGGLADHLAQGFFVRIDARRTPRPLPVRPGSYYLPVPEARSILFLSLWRVSRDELMLDVKINGELPPDPESQVACLPSAGHPWPTTVRSTVSTAGRAVVAAQQEVLADVWAAVAGAFGLAGEPAFGSYDEPRLGNTAVLPRYREQYPIGVPQPWCSALGAEDHEGGTLPLGGVLTENHEFARIAGLYAGGPATFPRIGAANPSLTTMALSRRLAAVLADELLAEAPGAGHRSERS